MKYFKRLKHQLNKSLQDNLKYSKLKYFCIQIKFIIKISLNQEKSELIKYMENNLRNLKLYK